VLVDRSMDEYVENFTEKIFYETIHCLLFLNFTFCRHQIKCRIKARVVQTHNRNIESRGRLGSSFSGEQRLETSNRRFSVQFGGVYSLLGANLFFTFRPS